jgi:hypothetical protein
MAVALQVVNPKAVLRISVENMFIQMSHQNPLILAHPCITAVGISTTALLRSKTLNPQKVIRRRILMALLLEVIGGKVHFITE